MTTIRNLTVAAVCSLALGGCMPTADEERACVATSTCRSVGDPCGDSEECVPNSVCFSRFCVGDGMLRVSLSFTADSDFDLHVRTPSGSVINWMNRAADGGRLDVDQCVTRCSETNHVENVVFGDTALSGSYEVWVINYDGRGSGAFEIEVSGDISTSFSGSLSPLGGERSEVFTFEL